ncbi:MAG: ABC transporter ATP-binding protein, partial [Clostridia bacterium]|nr:ABC transporter ATP-binding protein [Clostridia bacterium]
MLKLKDIKKTYTIGKKDDQQIVNALNGISLEFREHEFVSILGQSGCGKTTLLNIVGGLDKYTSGDLIINGISTKEYKDKDWDSYRNHRVGFIFQSYNLIPHLTVLQNVELALTLSGISKKERQERAKEVLKRVGLEDRINNKPNQLSGGQMQRVAIARALVNDPEIILADEPTGALDSKTSVQIMELLKKISDDKLIIMVTHNPELAQIYSSRIISLKDGCIIDDSMPYSSRLENKKVEDQLTDVEIIQNEVDAKNLEENKNSEIAQKEKSNVESAENIAEELNANEKNQNKKNKKKRMSFFTALSLSFKNLITKKARTILVSIAGSIGIIGIALILAVSSGFKGYIDKVQEETLSNYPLTIQSSTLDYTTIMTSLMGGGKEEDPKHELDGIYADTSLLDIMKEITSKTKTNDLQKFYAHLQENYDDIKPYINDIQYGYDVSIDVFNKNNFQVAPTSPAMYDIVLSFCVGYLENESIDKEAGDNVKGLDIVLNADGSYTLNLNTEASSVTQDRADAIVKQYLDENS